jgi:hypothetical protein
VVYALDTRELRLAAQQQIESAITPCVLIVENPHSESVEGDLFMKNAGVGVAINIRWRSRKKVDGPWNESPALGPGESRSMKFASSDRFSIDFDCSFRY